MQMSRRELLSRAATAAATLVVSQTLVGCATASATAAQDTSSAPGTTSANSSCVLTAALTEGPYFVDEKLDRSDLRTDPVTGAISPGALLQLAFNVARVSSGACSPLTGAYLDVWHCDAGGVYSDVSGSGTGHKFLRGYQVTDANGLAQFTTVYPGWYQGRAVHVHFKLRLLTGTTTRYEFTSQFFFDDSLTDSVHALSPYNTRGRRDTVNASDGIYNGISSSAKAGLTLHATKSGNGYNGVINLDVTVG